MKRLIQWLELPPIDGPTSTVLLRLMAGGVFLWEGILKFVYENQGVGRFTKLGMPVPGFTADFVAGLEIAGGLLLIAGLATRFIAVPLMVEMVVAMLSTKISLFLGTSPLAPPPVPPQMGIWAVLHEVRSEYAQLLTVAFLAVNGPGRWSLDARKSHRRMIRNSRGAETSTFEETTMKGQTIPSARKVFQHTVCLFAVATSATLAAAGGFPSSPVRRCSPDAVVAGTVCMDRYEASVWRVPDPTTTNALLVRKIQLGRASRDDLVAGGATQLGTSQNDYAPCEANGQNCADDLYAVSLPAVLPSAFATWFQAQEACANSAKRLPTNAEWQVAANGTPDAGTDDHATTCNNDSLDSTTLTGSRSACVSARGASDMAGNLAEWVADWVPRSTGCPGWGGSSDDVMCLAGANVDPPGPAVEAGPGALVRGGFFFLAEGSGPLAVIGTVAPTRSQAVFGFRCAR